MRSLMWAAAMVTLVGCEPPGRCLCIGPEEATVIDGDRVLDEQSVHPLEPVTRGCARRTVLSIFNPSRVSTTVSVTSDSPNIAVIGESGAILPRSFRFVELLATSNETALFLSTELTMEFTGLPTKKFELSAELIPPNPALPRTLDFGGVQVGTRRSRTSEALTGLRGDFTVTTDGSLEFAPTGSGRQRAEASYESMVDCPALNQVTLLGDGVPAVLNGPSTIDFGGVAIGSSAELEVEVTNFSFEPLRAALSALGAGRWQLQPRRHADGPDSDARWFGRTGAWDFDDSGSVCAF